MEQLTKTIMCFLMIFLWFEGAYESQFFFVSYFVILK
jgi:hypothetical protein